jgi:hypothetical protein
MRFYVPLWILLTLLVAGAAAAAEQSPMTSGPPYAADDFEPTEAYAPSAGAMAGAIAINLVYVPVRFAVTVAGAVLGGVEGFISCGDVGAAHEIFGLTDGSQVITPAMLEGRERWTFSGYGW